MTLRKFGYIAINKSIYGQEISIGIFKSKESTRRYLLSHQFDLEEWHIEDLILVKQEV